MYKKRVATKLQKKRKSSKETSSVASRLSSISSISIPKRVYPNGSLDRDIKVLRRGVCALHLPV